MDRLETFRAFYASLIVGNAGVPAGASNLTAAFASVPREQFIGPPPWRVFTPAGYIPVPSDDPAFLYQDITVALQSEGRINNGQPTLHARCIAALKIEAREAVLHVGAGSGYYTALLAELSGPDGSVVAYEIEQGLAERAKANLSRYFNVVVQHRSGSEGPLPECDVIYVNAGATSPMAVWLDALRPGGRLLFPLTPAKGFGGMLLVTHQRDQSYAARFVTFAMFIPCTGARDEETSNRLTQAFAGGSARSVRSLHRGTPPGDTCWFAGHDWWLSTTAIA